MTGRPEIQQHLDDAVDPRHFLEEHRGVLSPTRLVPELALHELHRAADGRERVADLVGQADGHLARRRQCLAAAHLRLELAEPRDVAHDGDGGGDRPAPSRQRSRHEAHVHRAAVGTLDHGGGLGAALAGGERVGQVPHEGRLGREDLLEGTAGHATRGTAEELLGRRVPQDDPEIRVHADERVRQPAHQRLVVEHGVHQASARSGMAFMVNGARSPASSRSLPAAAIIAALSVQSRAGGHEELPAAVCALALERLAAQVRVGGDAAGQDHAPGADPPARPWRVCLTSILTTVAWKDAAMSATSPCERLPGAANVQRHRRLDAAEGEVERAVAHAAVGKRMAFGSPPRAARSMAGPPG